jgi:hypothetical protein
MNTETSTFPANIKLPIQAQQPDVLFPGISINDMKNFIVSKDDNGHTVSVFSDNTWIFDTYDPRKRNCNMVFNYAIGNSTQALGIIRELKFIFICYLWLRPGKPLQVKSAVKQNSCLTSIARYSAKVNRTVFDILSSERHVTAMTSEIHPSLSRQFLSFLKVINIIDKNTLGFQAVNPSKIQSLSDTVQSYRDSIKQTPPVPARIYSKLINILNDRINLIDKYITSYLKVLYINQDDTLHGLTRNAQKSKLNGQGIKAMTDRNRYNHAQLKNIKSVYLGDYQTLTDLISNEKLEPFIEEVGIRLNPHGLASSLYEIQYLCKVIIQSFTGMRSTECNFLPYECLSSHETMEGNFPIIKGLTTKFGEKNASWVTNQLGIKAVNIAQKIATFVCNSTPEKTLVPKDEYLFISPTYSRIGAHFLPKPPKDIYLPTAFSTLIKSRCEYLSIEIQINDINDLEKIDPFRDWLSEYSVGDKWPLTNHQLRRSLSLYASRSGLVKLPSLMRQLQQITNYMALYYAKGSQFADDILEVLPDHFIKEYRETQPISQSIAYLSEILLSDETLFGNFGSTIEKGNIVTVTNEKKVNTLKMVKRGQIAYKETFLGGCTSIDRCDKKPLRSVIECIGCKSAIIKLSKLESIIASNKALLNSLDSLSTQFIAEKEDLDILIKYRESILLKDSHNV